MATLQILAGFVLLALGGEALVRGAVALARHLGISALLVGLVIVGFGTSMPELVTSIKAAWAEAPGLVFGNVLGSNIANILLVLGTAATVTALVCEREAFRRDGPMLALATAALVIVGYGGAVGRVGGAVFLVMLVAYVIVVYRQERAERDASARLHEAEADLAGSTPTNPLVAAGFTIGGMALLVAGADVMVTGAVTLARGWGVSETVIGLTILSIGTSLPELATCTIAALRGQAQVAVGNIIGSNLFNILGIMGITAVVHPVAVPAGDIRADLWIMAAVTAWLISVALTQRVLTRTEGFLFVLAYAAYLSFIYARTQGAF